MTRRKLGRTTFLALDRSAIRELQAHGYALPDYPEEPANDTELRPILSHARELTSNVEVLSEDVAVKLDRLTDLMNSVQHSLERGQLTLASGRSEGWPVESSETREDDRDA